MGKADELIERAERETGQRIDKDGYDNNAMSLIFGALAREMGKTAHGEEEDFAAGSMIRHKTIDAWKIEEKRNKLIADMLTSGVSPDSIGELLGGKK
jgi:hypothetical protein